MFSGVYPDVLGFSRVNWYQLIVSTESVPIPDRIGAFLNNVAAFFSPARLLNSCNVRRGVQGEGGKTLLPNLPILKVD